MAVKKKKTFEEQLAQAEALIGELESGSLPLEESLKRYEEGMALLAALEKELQSATQRLTVLRRGESGEEEEVPLEEDAHADI